ncbi:MAG: aldehyde ferredoxin oxidoreductase C-terminal domain-containing protein, partial [Actinobacteria bacterium]|nr:aldehyde ferredoxin oxidoreductase C-terminal domain-containing protein [Actinomycetota bacterium]
NLPTNNFRDAEYPAAKAVDAEAIRNSYRVGMEGCYACAVRCKKVVRIDGPVPVDPMYGGPEYETIAGFGPNCGVADLVAICKAHEMCNAAGLDTISASGCIAFAMECFEAGVLSPEDVDHLDLRFGNAEAMLKLLQRIIHRQGIGDLLAEGVRVAAERLGHNAKPFALHVKGQEIPMHEPRLKRALGLGYVVSPTGAEHQCNIHDTIYEKDGGPLAKLKPLGVLKPLPSSELGDAKVRLFTYAVNSGPALNNCLVMCDFLPYTLAQKTELVRAATGWDSVDWELIKVAERAATMARAFNARAGITPEADRLPGRFFQPQTSGPLARIEHSPVELESARRTYYEMMGWHPDTGYPTPGRLAELDISWVRDLLPR